MESSAKGLERYLQHENVIHHHVDEIGQIVKNQGEDLEGNSFYHSNTDLTAWFFLYKRVNFLNIILDHKVKKMAEIGFNAGHSAAVFLSVLPQEGSIIFFDLNDHKYASPCYNYLKSKYSQVKDFIPGDSRETVPTYIQNHPEETGTFDCIHVDGGHDINMVVSDINNSHKLLRPGGIMIIDDTQLKHIEIQIPILLTNGYSFLYQIPTYGYSHVCMMKKGHAINL